MDGIEEKPKGYQARYFKDWETKGLTADFIPILDLIRHDCGFPFRFTSTLRFGDPNSHGDGQAVDIQLHEYTSPIWNRKEVIDQAINNRHWKERKLTSPLTKGQQRLLICDMARVHGINRLGFYDKHSHLDISKRLPQDVLWVGVSK